jgi:hypothetical protein
MGECDETLPYHAVASQRPSAVTELLQLTQGVSNESV